MQSLNLIDSFLFQEITENEEDAKFIARLIIKRVMGFEPENIIVETEKVINGLNVDKRGIRMDLRILEKKDNSIAKILNIEPNTYQKKDLPKRCRYYQSVTDAKFFKANKHFEELPELISIWILEYDPFGENRMLYTVKNMVEENPKLCYNDGARKIFLYTQGEIGGSKELSSLLKYISNSNNNNVVDEELKSLHTLVNRIKEDEGTGEKYMTLQEYIDCEIELRLDNITKQLEEEVKAEAKEELKAEGIEIFITSFLKCNISKEEISKLLMEGYSISKEEADKYIALAETKIQ